MGDTNSLGLPETSMTPGISEASLKKGVVVASGRFDDTETEIRPDKFVVRIPKTQLTVSLKLNTRLLAEQREIEQLNEAIRRAGW